MARVDDGRTSVTGLDVGPAFLLQFDDDDQVYRVTVTVEPEGTEP